ncbi:DNA polymerase III subunit gamma and tau [Bifidobacterium oedipodis]|uniref:DNA-directed DNA polymerase n=1 Tax=Bifidobacterium oedipodis TaxID=2675322 RepID=A0A7Y0ENW9_9BIFI|nr:DNA polymerase III subunit gamma and tau [Bifidobacterium sp. DSM 109957]NMM93328.1 DNA polymerase III subunit gamma/tau [Bifidobacterium sp. DSM 109957]
MALALYRRYRPDTFEGVIGQDQVTIPLMRALDEGKLTHAYLFSGPRGCGKTSSARILARCVNCAKGPTSHPCGECASCKDLATGGPGSIDVVEIDAASHNGVDDARELRERAGFAPARDRYKIFILDEAHMVTQQGFNALLKIVEEPPEHVMFIFATTEPDKVIGTIRSRTHHYPFRLVPQEVMGPYLETICAKEGISPEPGVLKLAMRAGGGSMRDTLSVLDQLMVGSVKGVITHDAAVALLGFTPEALIGEALDAVIDRNGEALYGVIQKVVVGGFDPRRFVEDLLARVRDLLVLTLAGDKAESVLSDTAEAEDLDDLHRQAAAFGLGALTAMADIINTTLGAMTGAISPRMRLELLAARLLAGAESGFASAGVAPAGVSGSSTGAGAGQASGDAQAGSSASGAAAGGFAGASRGGFVGASHGGFSGAQRNQRPQPSPSPTAAAPAVPVAASQVSGSAVHTGAVAPTGTAPAASPTSAGAAAPAMPAAPSMATVPNAGQQGGKPAVADSRTVDEQWDAAVAAMPSAIREYVSRDKVPVISFGPNRKGVPCVSLTFDQPLSQHAFALAVDTDSGRKASAVVIDAVRQQFGANVSIAPTPTAANGERVEPVSRMSPEQKAKVKQQIAMAKAGLAVSNLGASLGVRTGGEPASPKSPAAGASEDADDNHRAGVAAAPTSAGTSGGSWPDVDDPWAKPLPTAAKQAAEPHPHKHVAVPDVSDGIDPWATPSTESPAVPATGVSTGNSTGMASGGAKTADSSPDPWSQPQPGNSPATDPWSQPQPSAPVASQPSSQAQPSIAQPLDDPWNQPMSSAPASADPWNQPAGGMSASADPWSQPQQPIAPPEPNDPWNQPQPPAAAPQQSNDPWSQPQPSQPQPSRPQQSAPASAEPDPWSAGQSPQQPNNRPQVAAEDDEYSMNDQSLGEATAMDLDSLKKMFEVKKVEEFAADDPKNPKNIQPAKKHTDE